MHFCILTHAFAADPSAALLIGQQSYPATLLSAENASLTLQREGQPTTIDLRDLVAWGTPADARGGAQIILADGGLLVADILDLAEERLNTDSALLRKMPLPLEQIAGIVFHMPRDPARRDSLIDRIRTRQEKSDLLILDNGDEVTGTLRNISRDEIELEAVAGKLNLKRDRVVALGFDPSLVQAPPANGLHTIVGLADGSRLLAQSFTIAGGKASLNLMAGPKAEATVDQIVYLQPLGGRVTYLSDLKPAAYKHIPYLELPWEYRLDRNVLGTTLRIKERLYPKGIGMHSASRLTFPLSGHSRRFAAHVALDAATGSRGSVAFRVFVDAEQKYASPIIRGGDEPLPITVELPADARSLSLIVDFAERGDELDYANWLNARLEE